MQKAHVFEDSHVSSTWQNQMKHQHILALHFEMHDRPSSVSACMKVSTVIWKRLEIPCNTRRCYGWRDLQHIPWFDCNCILLFWRKTFKRRKQRKWGQILNHLFTRKVLRRYIGLHQLVCLFWRTTWLNEWKWMYVCETKITYNFTITLQ